MNIFSGIKLKPTKKKETIIEKEIITLDKDEYVLHLEEVILNLKLELKETKGSGDSYWYSTKYILPSFYKEY